MALTLALRILFGLHILGIISLPMIVSIQNFNTNCGGSLISLPMWLIINNCLIILFLIVLTINLLSDSKVVVILTILDLIFKIIWTIIGTVALFRDSMDCYTNAQYLWVMTLVLIILNFALIVTTSFNIYDTIFDLYLAYNPIPNQDQDKNIQEI